MITRLVAPVVVCMLLLPWPTVASARQQAAGPIGDRPTAPAREHLANTRALPLSRLLGLCGEVKKLVVLEGQLGKRPLTQEDIHVVSNGTKCLAATASIFETIRVMAPLYQERVVCMPGGVKDQDLLEGMLKWLEGQDRQGNDDLFRLSAPQAFIIYIRKAYPCTTGE